ncbi:MAG TPA: hypothetical protein VEQ10_10450 [Vicinamibacteria bacterium]|nr:hypothetical protein [Vicinamibacteria bacterium]
MPRWTAVALLLLAGCGASNPGGVQPSPSPLASPTPGLPGVTAGVSTGPTVISLLAAEPAPGSALGGCGEGAAGCTGRIRMRFALRPSGSGAVLWCVAYLHASNQVACLQARTAGLTLRSGELQTVDVVFDTADTGGYCGTPLDITHLAFVVEGVSEVASRQEWALRYELGP